ncbi:MAG: M67 family metallopeptidase [Chthoniobacterales bacterium]|nr:M67 family metallopeptidase [Chthoniobacterales bacterium]
MHMPPAFARQIESEGVASYPNECCGIIFGKDIVSKDAKPQRCVTRLEPVANGFEADEQYHRFSITPETLMRAEKESATRSELVLGFYHSHPDHPARPSEYDRAHAWPFYSYVIVSIAKGEAVDMTSWMLDEQAETFSRQDIIETAE